MGLFSRAKDEDLGELLAKSDDPLKLIRRVIREMEDTLVEARSTAVRALARRKELERSIAERRAQAADWEQKAEFALSRQREDLARGALTMKQRLAGEIAALESSLPPVEDELNRLENDIAELRVKLADAQHRQRLLSVRSDSATSRKKIREQLAEPKAGAAQRALDETERAVDRLQAEADSYAMGDRRLAAEFARLETDSRVDDELNRLREKLRTADPQSPKS